MFRCESCRRFFIEPSYDFGEDGFNYSRCPHCDARQVENKELDYDLIEELLDGLNFDDINSMRSKWDKCKW